MGLQFRQITYPFFCQCLHKLFVLVVVLFHKDWLAIQGVKLFDYFKCRMRCTFCTYRH